MKYLILFVILFITACSTKEAPPVSYNSDGSRVLSVVSVDLSPKKGTDRWYTTEELKEGRVIFENNCASCHGKKAESIESWRKLDANDNYPPPPLNGSAHAWHHPLEITDKVIRDGGKPLGGTMPAWGDILDEEQRLKAVASFQDYWSDEIYNMWLEREISNRDN